MKARLCSIALGALVLGAGVAQATPSTIIPGKALGGKIGAKSAAGADGAKFDCYAIEVPAGTEFTVNMEAQGFTPEVWIARGAQCDSVAMQAMSEPAEGGAAKVSFTSAGGRYLVFARGGGAKGGTYKIKVESVTSPVAGVSEAADSGSPAEAGTPADGGEEIDPRVALMNQQVAVREAQIAEERRIAAERERERQRQLALQRQREAEARARAEAEANSGGGDIFGRALGGFLMGAMLGSGSDQAMEMAVAGAQAAASGGNGLEVINSIGAASGVSSSGGSMGASASSGMASAPMLPNTLAGSSACGGMNESNYRQVGLSGGGDTQMKTQCAMAYEYYNQYKNAVAQGYSAADAQRTYDAFQKTAMQVQQFQSETSGGTAIHQDTRGPQAPRPVQSSQQTTTGSSTCNAPEHTSCVSPQ